MAVGIDTGGGGFSGSSAATSGAEYNGSNTFGGFNYKSSTGELSSTTLMIVGAAVVFGLFILKK